MRIPGWARNQPVPGDLYSYLDRRDEQTSISVNGGKIPYVVDRSGYVSLRTDWKDGDVVEIAFPFEVRRVVANPKVRADNGRMAVERGPIVFCSEWPDCEGGHVLGLLFDPKSELAASVDGQFYGGVPVINGKAKNISNPLPEPRPVKLIPYYLWANRGAGEMSVWLSKAEYALGDTGPAGGLIFYINPNYASRWLAVFGSRPLRSKRGRQMGLFPDLDTGGARQCGGYRQGRILLT